MKKIFRKHKYQQCDTLEDIHCQSLPRQHDLLVASKPLILQIYFVPTVQGQQKEWSVTCRPSNQDHQQGTRRKNIFFLADIIFFFRDYLPPIISANYFRRLFPRQFFFFFLNLLCEQYLVDTFVFLVYFFSNISFTFSFLLFGYINYIFQRITTPSRVG